MMLHMRSSLFLLSGLLSAASAEIVLHDDFESPLAGTSYSIEMTSGKIDNSLWVRTETDAYASNRNGLVSQLHPREGAFNMPSGNQAWTHRYSSNGGLTSAFGKIGPAVKGQTITVTFDAFKDPSEEGSKGSDYKASLVLFDGVGIRNEMNSEDEHAVALLASVSGVAMPAWTTYRLRYTVGDPVIDNDVEKLGLNSAWSDRLLGLDLAVRFGDGGNSALIDNVSVEVTNRVKDDIPESSTLLLLAGCLLPMIKRPRR